jgi:hypothetical protein
MRKNEADIKKRAAVLFASWRADWNKFIKEVLGVTLDEEQQAIVTAVQTNLFPSVPVLLVARTSWLHVALFVGSI